MPTGASAVVDPETARGATERFERLFRTHQRAVFGWILRIVRDEGAAEDLTIETFWRIYRALDRYDERRAFEPWARTIATRVALEWLRRRPSVEPIEADAELAAEGSGNDPAIAEEVRAAVRAAFAHLPAKLRAAATLVVLEQMPQREAAAALETTVAAVKVRVFRALRLLRKELRAGGMWP